METHFQDLGGGVGWGEGIGRLSYFFTLLNEHIRLVNNRFIEISVRPLEQVYKNTDALGFKFYIHPSPVDSIWACCLQFPTSTGQMFYGFRYSSDRCATPDVGVCKYYLGLVPHGSFAQHRDLGSGLFLQTFDGVALRSQNLPHKVKLTETQNRERKLAVKSRPVQPAAVVQQTSNLVCGCDDGSCSLKKVIVFCRV